MWLSEEPSLIARMSCLVTDISEAQTLRWFLWTSTFHRSNVTLTAVCSAFHDVFNIVHSLLSLSPFSACCSDDAVSYITSASDIQNVKPDVTVLFHVLLKARLLEN